MKNTWLLDKLKSYKGFDKKEELDRIAFIELLETYPNCFDRKQMEGHVTGGAWIVNPEKTHVLLTHHLVLDRWFQPGGHSDGKPKHFGSGITRSSGGNWGGWYQSAQ